MPTSTHSSVPIMNSAASTAAPVYTRSRNDRIGSLHRAIGVDHTLAVVAGLLLPFGEHEVANLAQVGGELRAGLDDFHAVRLQLVEVPAVLFLGDLPAARFRCGARLEDRGLRRLVECVERLAGDQ